MTEVTLHFEGQTTMSDAQLAAFVATLQEKASALDEVDAARSEHSQSKLVGVDDVILVLTVATKLMVAGGLTLEALHKLIAASKKVAVDLGWKGTVTVEADGGRVKPEELEANDAAFISRGAES